MQDGLPDFVKELLLHGLVIIPHAVSAATCDVLAQQLREKMAVLDQEKYLQFWHNPVEGKEVEYGLPFNYSPGHFQVQPPSHAGMLFEEILANSYAISACKAVFGPSFALTSYTCNANVGAALDQPFHMDCSHHHPTSVLQTLGFCGPPYQIIANFYLQDTDLANGSLEVIPFTHQEPRFELDEDGRVSPATLSPHLSQAFRCNGKKGTLILRDKRTWHRGTQARAMFLADDWEYCEEEECALPKPCSLHSSMSHQKASPPPVGSPALPARFMLGVTYSSLKVPVPRLRFPANSQSWFEDTSPVSRCNLDFM